MARVKLTVRTHVHAPARRNVVPTESHSDGQYAGYFPRTLRTMLLALGYSEPLLFVGVPRLLRENSYLWRVQVINYNRPMTDCIRRIRHVVEATTPRWTFEGGAYIRHEKLWRCYNMKRRNKWSNRSTATSQAAPKEELKLS
jgi:hypothetical protein